MTTSLFVHRPLLRGVLPWLLALVLLGRDARADEAAEAARAAYQQGIQHYNLAEFEEALKAFTEAYRKKPDPVFLFNIAQCHRHLGRFQDAAFAFRRYLQAAEAAPNREQLFKVYPRELIQTWIDEANIVGVKSAPSTASPPATAPGGSPPAAAAPAASPARPPGPTPDRPQGSARPEGTGARPPVASAPSPAPSVGLVPLAPARAGTVPVAALPPERAAAPPEPPPPRRRAWVWAVAAGAIAVAAIAVTVGLVAGLPRNAPHGDDATTIRF